jgi:hypothetical protein
MEGDRQHDGGRLILSGLCMVAMPCRARGADGGLPGTGRRMQSFSEA